MNTLELVRVLSPSIVARAERLEAALRLIQQGRPRADVHRVLVKQYGVTIRTAWRIVSMADDIGGKA